MKIAFTGNPNSGKTTMYNALTGRNEKVGNWAGVTVDKKEAWILPVYAGEEKITAVDLPGTYSLSPFTSEERVTRSYILDEHPDVIINIVDATNLSRSLFLTTQLLELEIPVVVALNKTDINQRKQTRIDTQALSQALGCPVLETISTDSDNQDLQALIQAAKAVVGTSQTAPFHRLPPSDTKTARIGDRKRFAFVDTLVRQAETRKTLTRDRTWQDSLDTVLTHPLAGLPVFALVMFLVFQISQNWLGVWIAEGYTFANGFTIPGLVTLMDAFQAWVAELLAQANADVFLSTLLTDGILGGISAVVGFLPLIMVMYFLIAILEDCGYMARATVVLDPIFKKVGLSGKSVIPFIIGTGCAIPGVMAARTIRNERERNATAMLTPWMPCGAKLPVITLFSRAFFPDTPWIGTLMYFAAIGLILLGALLVKYITGVKKRKSFFIMELPEYKLPSLKRAFVTMGSQGWAYIVKAGTIILLCNTAVYLMQAFDWRLTPVETGMEHTSILASIAGPVATVLIPLVGIHAWQLAAAAVTGFIAKENVVGTLAVCYSISNLIDTDALEMVEGADASVAAVFGLTKVAALAYLVFNLFTPPCFAAIGAMRAEIHSNKWFWGGIALQLATGYTMSYLVYTIGTLLTAPASLHLGAALGGGIFVAAFAAVLALLCVRANKLTTKQKSA